MRIRFSIPLILMLLVGFGSGACKKKPKKSGSTQPLGNIPKSLPAPTLKAESVTFTKKRRPVGTVVIHTSRMRTSVAVKGNNGKGRFGSLDVEQSRQEILRVKDATVTKLMVTYQKKSAVSKQDSKTQTVISPLQGKTFILGLDEGAVRITDGDGKPVSVRMTKLVREEQKTFGAPSRLYRNLPIAPIHPGQRVPWLQTAMRQHLEDENLADPKNKRTMTELSVVFKGTELWGGEKIAVFSLSVTLTIRKRGGNMVIRSQGYVRLRVNGGWKIKQEVVGDLDLKGRNMKGRIHIVQNFTFK